jgi:VWFA-related protein
MLAALVLCGGLLRAQNPGGQSPAPPPAPAPNPDPDTKVWRATPDTPKSGDDKNAELSSQDRPATFKVRVNEVLVRVVVRDQKGQVVPNLHKEDFQLLDNRKPQTISSFSSETPESLAIKPAVTVTEGADAPADADADVKAAAAKKMPQRFVAVFFDDVHLTLQDSTFVRDAGTRLFAALAPSDRVGIYTSSGQLKQPFTADRELLHKALLGIVPRSISGGAGFHDCPDVSYYQADLIDNKRDQQALTVAAEEAVQCAFSGDETKLPMALPIAESASRRALARGDQETEYAYRHVEEVMRQLSVMPGQRVMVFVSPGFIPSTLWSEISDMIDRANRSAIVMNTIDARGLYAPEVLGDIADPQVDSPRTVGLKSSYRAEAQFAQEQVLEQFAFGTGGTFFHNRNDVDEGLRQAVAAPPRSYLIGFSPQNLKVDGRFHQLKVTLTGKQKYTLQARNGYYAPKTIADPAESAKQEIREAIFSQEEMHDVPVDLQTQFFKKDSSVAKLSVLAHLDVKGIHFRKADGRNHDNLTIATAIFDENGNFVVGGEKLVQMKLLDTTYTRLSRSGITMKSTYDVKPGSYLVRLVVRDAEGSQMAARNGAVVIPN